MSGLAAGALAYALFPVVYNLHLMSLTSAYGILASVAINIAAIPLAFGFDFKAFKSLKKGIDSDTLDRNFYFSMLKAALSLTAALTLAITCSFILPIILVPQGTIFVAMFSSISAFVLMETYQSVLKKDDLSAKNSELLHETHEILSELLARNTPQHENKKTNEAEVPDELDTLKNHNYLPSATRTDSSAVNPASQQMTNALEGLKMKAYA